MFNDLKNIDRKSVGVDTFGGINNKLVVPLGEWKSMQNISVEKYPVFSPRGKRTEKRLFSNLSYSEICSLVKHEGIYYVCYKDAQNKYYLTAKGESENVSCTDDVEVLHENSFYTMGNNVAAFPGGYLADVVRSNGSINVAFLPIAQEYSAAPSDMADDEYKSAADSTEKYVGYWGDNELARNLTATSNKLYVKYTEDNNPNAVIAKATLNIGFRYAVENEDGSFTVLYNTRKFNDSNPANLYTMYTEQTSGNNGTANTYSPSQIFKEDCYYYNKANELNRYFSGTKTSYEVTNPKIAVCIAPEAEGVYIDNSGNVTNGETSLIEDYANSSFKKLFDGQLFKKGDYLTLNIGRSRNLYNPLSGCVELAVSGNSKLVKLTEKLALPRASGTSSTDETEINEVSGTDEVSEGDTLNENNVDDEEYNTVGVQSGNMTVDNVTLRYLGMIQNEAEIGHKWAVVLIFDYDADFIRYLKDNNLFVYSATAVWRYLSGNISGSDTYAHTGTIGYYMPQLHLYYRSLGITYLKGTSGSVTYNDTISERFRKYGFYYRAPAAEREFAQPLFPTSISIKRALPENELSCYISHNNRLWAVDNTLNEIKSTALGSFYTWCDYRGLASDSYSATVGTDGDFNASCVLNNYLFFFKEHSYSMVYGTKPSNYHIASVTDFKGINKESAGTLQVINGVAYFLAVDGRIYQFNGNKTALISDKLGDVRYKSGTAAHADSKYYLLAYREDNSKELLVYDTLKGLWTKEDCDSIDRLFNIDGSVYSSYGSERLKVIKGINAVNETDNSVEWFAETGRLGLDSDYRQYISGIDIALECAPGAEIKILIKYGNEKHFKQIKHIVSAEAEHYRTFAAVKRCGFFTLRFEGKGDVKIYKMSYITEQGSEL